MDVGSLLFGSQLANISVRKGRARKSDFEPPCDLRERMSREWVKQHTSPNESRSKTEISNLCNLLLFVFPLKESQLKLCMQHLTNQIINCYQSVQFTHRPQFLYIQIRSEKRQKSVSLKLFLDRKFNRENQICMSHVRRGKKRSELGHFQLQSECSLEGLISLGQVREFHFSQHHSVVLIPTRSAACRLFFFKQTDRKKASNSCWALKMLYLSDFKTIFWHLL